MGAGSTSGDGSNDPAAEPAHGRLLEEIRNHLAETFQIPPADLSDDIALLRGRLDSIGLLVLVAHLEEMYGITIAEEEVGPGNFGTLRDVARFVTSRRESLGDGSLAPGRSSPAEFPSPEAEVDPKP